MNRRTLFGRLATVVAAATVAAHVEPARAEAFCDEAPETAEAEAIAVRMRETPEFQAEVNQLAAKMYSIECGLGGATAADAIPLAVSFLHDGATPLAVINSAQTTPILEFKRDENGTPMIVVPPGVKHDAAFGALVDLWNKGQHDA